jgi:leader peptidase (prepilin peptidase)/N-methyltransferase
MSATLTMIPFWFIISVTVLFGLIIGSFLNVVIARIPRMLEREWHTQCTEFLGSAPQVKETESPFNLCIPASHCPQCKAKIAFYDNIPLLSYCWLKGRCRHCHNKISIRYPLVEGLSAVLALFVILTFGVTLKAAAALLFVWSLIALTFIDIDEQILPDQITLPLLWLGLIFNINALFIDLPSAVIGAVTGYVILWSIYWAYKLLTKKEGMGYGDFKLLAMIGAWLGVQSLPMTLFFSSLIGSIVGITNILIGKSTRDNPISFGPFLALGAILALFLGPQITHYYLSLLGF